MWRKGFIWLTSPDHNTSLRKVRARTEAEAMKECLLLAYTPWLPPACFLNTTQDCILGVINREPRMPPNERFTGQYDRGNSSGKFPSLDVTLVCVNWTTAKQLTAYWDSLLVLSASLKLFSYALRK